jgi:hypothetical protein
MSKLGASYKIDLRIVNNPVEAGYDASVGDVFTEVVRNEEMRNESFIINVTSSFLERQPEILFEASSLHEVCHVMNDDVGVITETSRIWKRPRSTASCRSPESCATWNTCELMPDTRIGTL